MTELRPIYFIVVCWGERFRNYLTDICLPALLSPNNIPSLSGGHRNKFIFCTTPQDWSVLHELPIMDALRRHIEPCYIEIPPAPPGRSGCEHMGLGHKLAAELAHKDQAYGVFITPDLMVSDGTVAALERHAVAGREVVLAAALRFEEEALFDNLRRLGVVPDGPPSQPGRPLPVSGRELVAAAIRSFHSETRRYEWSAPHFTDFPCACWWQVPREDGIVLHSLSWCPLLLDYAVVSHHDTTTLDTWTLDGDYVYRNFKESRVHVVTDSDEMMLVSWAPASDRPQSLSPSFVKSVPIVGDVVKGAILRGTLTSGIFDPLKQRLFFLPVRWHARELTPAWVDIERKAMTTLTHYLDDFARRASVSVAAHPVRSSLFRVLAACGRVWIVAADLVAHRTRLAARLGQVFRGDVSAVKRIWLRLKIVGRTIIGAHSTHS
jgi:hypothetical protein